MYYVEVQTRGVKNKQYVKSVINSQYSRKVKFIKVLSK